MTQTSAADALDEVLAKAATSTHDSMKLELMKGDFAKLALMLGTKAGDGHARTELQKWVDGPDELKKAIGGAWLARAGKVVAGAGKKVMGAAEGAGERAGRKIGQSAPVQARGGFSSGARGKAVHEGGMSGESEAHHSFQREVRAGALRRGEPAPTRGFYDMDSASHTQQMYTRGAHPETVKNARILGEKGAAGRYDGASSRHAETYARMGRTAARRGVQIGASLAGAGVAGAAAAGASHMSEAQVEQRRNAAKARWAKSGHTTNVGGKTGAGNGGHWNQRGA